ncbi:hypothetical protein QBC37DRAFT_148393 [Rhypophila decipiens]|uniref:Smr domain-containing protein n=1 Tax=Rhypophila decipiens TaxID=261697 RepID=A0AAN6Y8C5_9PEZI|nr:hypothetical protein QBC37DRAFT_148393 [Rhypophila decipiens]
MAIPLERIGGRAFNHNAAEDAEAEYDRLRDLARREADRKKSCFDRAHEAYSQGDGAAAKELSEEGKKHQRQQDAYNKQASEFIFRENNSPDRVPDDTIDLHGQFVEEAEDILEARIRDAQARGQSHLHVIVGKGNHSAGRVQKIKPRVESLCKEMGLDYATEENEGRLYVDLTGGRVSRPPPLSEHRPPAHGGGYGGEDRPQGHSRPPQHHEQQQQRPDRQEDEVEKAISKCLGCCVVM